MASLFTKILNGEIPGDIVYQDEKCFAIKDISPQAPVHLLIIPKKEIVSVGHADDSDKEVLGHMLLIARDLARDLNLTDRGFRLVANIGDEGGQTVPHLHIHLLGGRNLTWPPG